MRGAISAVIALVLPDSMLPFQTSVEQEIVVACLALHLECILCSDDCLGQA